MIGESGPSRARKEVQSSSEHHQLFDMIVRFDKQPKLELNSVFDWKQYEDFHISERKFFQKLT